jgi:hypothetical protein
MPTPDLVRLPCPAWVLSSGFTWARAPGNINPGSAGEPRLRPRARTIQWRMSKFAIVKEFWSFLRVRKKWWLAPIVLFLLLLGGILIFAKGSALAPFIYSLF